MFKETGKSHTDYSNKSNIYKSTTEKTKTNNLTINKDIDNSEKYRDTETNSNYNSYYPKPFENGIDI
jgi:hypothetical protein